MPGLFGVQLDDEMLFDLIVNIAALGKTRYFALQSIVFTLKPCRGHDEGRISSCQSAELDA